jgi:hypothetical protein
MIYIAVVGTRYIFDYNYFKSILDKHLFECDKINITLVSGGCSGADIYAEQYAKNNNIKIIVFYAQWKKYGRKAGPMRNNLIEKKCDICIAFPIKSSRGTKHTTRLFEKHNKELYVYYVDNYLTN